MVSVSNLLYPLLYYVVFNKSSSASTAVPLNPKLALVSTVDNAKSFTAEIVVHNLFPTQPPSLITTPPDFFPRVTAPEISEETSVGRSVSLKDKLRKLSDTFNGVVTYMQGNQLALYQAYQRSAFLTLHRSERVDVQSLAQRFRRLPLEALFSNPSLRPDISPDTNRLISAALTLLNQNHVVSSERIWIHKMIQWIQDLSSKTQPSLIIREPHEAELTRAQLERYLLQDTLLKKTMYVDHHPATGAYDENDLGGIEEIFQRVKLLKEMKDKVPHLFSHQAGQHFQEMFEILMTARSVGEPALDPVRRDLLARLYKSIYFIILTGPEKERVLAYKVLKHLLTHAPQTQIRLEKLLFSDRTFRQKIDATEALVTLDDIISSRRTTEKAKELIKPLKSFQNTRINELKDVLHKIIYSDVDENLFRKQLYLSVSLVSRLNTGNDLYFQMQLWKSRKLLERVSGVWELMYPQMSLESIPRHSYEYRLFTTRPEFLEFAERYLLIRQWEGRQTSDLAALGRRVANLPVGWYRLSARGAISLLERFTMLLNTAPLVLESSPYDAMRIYELLAQLLKHNWPVVIDSFTKELEQNAHLEENVQILARLALGDDIELSPLSKSLCKELSKWIIDRFQRSTSISQLLKTFWKGLAHWIRAESDTQAVPEGWYWRSLIARRNRLYRLRQYMHNQHSEARPRSA